MGRIRSRLTVTTIALALIALAAGAATVVAPAAAARRNPTYAPKDCTKPQVEPRRIVFACADNGLYVNHLRWTKWRHRRAKGKGVLHERDCNPSCVGGGFKDYPVKIRLRKVKRASCGGKRVPLFRKAILNFPHKAPSDAHRVHKNPLYCTG
jgi:hypothetical protein